MRLVALLLAAQIALTDDALAEEPLPVDPPSAEAADAAAGEAPSEAVGEAAAPAEAAPAAAPDEPVEEAEVVPPPSPFTIGLILSLCALAIGGLSAVLGIWVDRDRARPVGFAMAMTVLIVSAVGVGMFQGILDSEGAIAAKADLARMLDMVNEIALASGDPTLAALVAEEGGTAIEIPPPPPPEPPAPEPVPGDTDAPAHENPPSDAPAPAAPAPAVE